MNNPYPLDCCPAWVKDVEKLEEEGLTRSDAQGCADIAHEKLHKEEKIKND